MPAGTTKIATVDVAAPNAVCTGIATTQATSCTACANLGLGGAVATGGTPSTCVLSANSPCCNFPLFYLAFTNATVTRYSLLEFIVVPSVRARRGPPPRRAGVRPLTSPPLGLPGPGPRVADGAAWADVPVVDAAHAQRLQRQLCVRGRAHAHDRDGPCHVLVRGPRRGATTVCRMR